MFCLVVVAFVMLIFLFMIVEPFESPSVSLPDIQFGRNFIGGHFDLTNGRYGDYGGEFNGYPYYKGY